jgi:tetratricopeptide (TPR) repeat protein
MLGARFAQSMPLPKPSTIAEASAVAGTLRRATAHHQRGQLNEAEALYRQALTRQPKNFDALHLLGVLMHQRGKSSEALELIGEALKSNAQSAAALSNQAIVLAALGKNDEALTSYDQAIALKPDYAEALNSRGNLLVKLGRTADALKSYERSIAANPRSLDALTNYATVLRLDGRDEEAASTYMRALAIDNRAEVWVALGNTFDKLQRFDEALTAFDRALALKPLSAEFLCNRGNALWHLRRPAEALGCYDAALLLKADAAEIHNNRGNALLDLNQPEEALASFDRALTLKPGYTEASVNRANALRDLNRSQEAIASCDAALAINPELAEAHWNKSLEQLLLGDFAQGFANYEWRWKRAGTAPRDFGVPQWRGADIKGKTTLLHAEQGFGDTIQFVRYVPMLAARGAKVVLEVPDSLRPLLGKLDGVIAMISRGQPHPAIDLHCPLMSLPFAFGTTLETVPTATPYLHAPADRVDAWRAKLPASGKLRVGLVWSGKPSHRNDHNRSIAFERLTPLLAQSSEQDGVDFVSLQHEVRDADKAALSTSAVLRPDLESADFADTAAVIETLDLVIAVDTAVAHLAGSMGKPLWLLLPFSPDWRWMLDRDDSPWYPCARLFRQPKIADWDSVILRLREALASEASTRQTRGEIAYL